MTKLKSKKMTKSTFAIIIMAIAMVAMLAFGGTYAYFTAEAESQAANATLAEIFLKNGNDGTITISDNLLPTEEVTADVTYTDESTRGTWVFFEITGETADFKITKVELVGESSNTELSEETEGSGVYFYKNGTEADTASETIKIRLTVKYTGSAHSVEGTDSTNTMGSTIELGIAASSIQIKGFDNAADAWAELNK